MLGLSAMLCMPVSGYAESVTTNATLTQAAQTNRTVKGTVVDEMNMPMIGVTVRVVGTKTATVTDFDGNFNIKAKATDKLELSYIGYEPLTVSASQASLSLKMKPEAAALNEVVVIGYGTVKKRDLTGAVTSIKAADITASPMPNPIEGLQGKVAGLDITRSSGQAGAGSSMKLRGTRSLTAGGGEDGTSGNDEPMVLIDGLPGSLSTLNANDIESIEVLKDAASTAVYGSAGANGIIIVTTKSGKEGKAKVNFNAYVGVNGWSQTPKMYSGAEFFNLAKQAKIAAGNVDIADEDVFNADVYQAYLAGKSVNWADELLKTGVTQNYSLSVSGGTEKTKAYLSLNFSAEDGQYSNDNYKVYSSNLKIDHKLSDIVSIGANMQGSFTYKNSAYARLESALIANPIGSAYDDEGNVNVFPVAGDNSTVSLLVNNSDNYRNNNINTRIYLNPYIRITPLKGLTFESRLSAALAYSTSNRFEGIGSYQYYNKDKTADGINTSANVYGSVANNNSYNYKWENILTYNFDIKDHSFTLTGVTSWNHNRREYTYAYADNITSNEYLWHNLGAGQNMKNSTSYTMSKGLGFVGRINYSYLGKYLASVSVRHDGSSRLADGNRWDTFPAFSLGWRVSEEKFMDFSRNWLDNMKIRFGYGVTGTASIPEYQTMSNLIQSYFILGNQTLLSYKYPTQFVDPNLGWEKSYNTNIGLDMSFLRGRIDFTMDYYITKTKDIIWTSQVPIVNGGYDSSTPYKITTNICESENRGVEMALTGRPFIAKNDGDFAWTINATFTKNSEKLTSFSDAGSSQYINGDRILKEGEPINSFYSYKLKGTWKTSEADDAAVFNAVPGDLKIDCPGLKRGVREDGTVFYTAMNADGELVEYDAANPYDATQAKQVIGHPNPDWTMGFKNTFNYKGFDLSIYLYWRYGQMINYSMLGRFNTAATTNFPTYFDYWTPETGDRNHVYPALNAGKDITQYDGYSGLTYGDGSFFKVKNITLGYTLPKSVLKKLGVENCRFYGTITNPFVFAKSELLEDYDPEMAGNLDYPLTKQLVFGVNVSF